MSPGTDCSATAAKLNIFNCKRGLVVLAKPLKGRTGRVAVTTRSLQPEHESANRSRHGNLDPQSRKFHHLLLGRYKASRSSGSWDWLLKDSLEPSMHTMRTAVRLATKHLGFGNLLRHGLLLKEIALPAPQLCIRQNSACARNAVVARQRGFHHDAGYLQHPSSLHWLSCQIALGL